MFVAHRVNRESPEPDRRGASWTRRETPLEPAPHSPIDEGFGQHGIEKRRPKETRGIQRPPFCLESLGSLA